MLPLIMDLCKTCAQESDEAKKLEIRERISVIWSRLMNEAILEYRTKITIGIEPKETTDYFLGKEDLLIRCEDSCYSCKRHQEAKMFLIIDEIYSLCEDEKPTKKKKKPTLVSGKAKKKTPTSLVEYRQKTKNKLNLDED